MTLEPTLQFLGAAGTVTGSKHLLSVNGKQILLDCGLFQGLRDLRERNWQEPLFRPSEMEAVVLSHAHLDHSGYLPLLAKKGFRGPIYCTSATKDLLPVLLLDSAHLQEEEAMRANRYGYSKHKPALPLYTREDAEASLRLLQTRPYGEAFSVTKEIQAIFRRAGHILGSATIELRLLLDKPMKLVFSGDLGRGHRPIIRDPEPIDEADILLLESTYGDRIHPANAKEELARIIRDAVEHRRAILVPAFAVGRTQELIWLIRQLEEENKIPSIPVFIDSPMAINVTDIYCRHPEDHDLEMKMLMDEKRCPLCCKQYHLARTSQESRALNNFQGSLIIIAGSGMATGGRILHHFKQRLNDQRTVVLLVGYQASGTRGRLLQDGAKSIRLYGEEVSVRAKIETLDGLSAHADREEILQWLGQFKKKPQQVYLVHGESEPARQLANAIEERLHWSARVAKDQEIIPLTKGT